MEIEVLRQEFKSYKEATDKRIAKLEQLTEEQVEQLSNTKSALTVTDYKYEQIIKTLGELKTTISNMSKQLEELKNKPAKRYEQVITGFISAIVGAVGGFFATKFFGGN